MKPVDPGKGRHYRFIVRRGEYDPDEELRKRGIVLGPDDGVIWRELVAPPDRPPWYESTHTAHGANDEIER